MNNTLLRRQEGAAFSAGDKKGRPKLPAGKTVKSNFVEQA